MQDPTILEPPTGSFEEFYFIPLPEVFPVTAPEMTLGPVDAMDESIPMVDLDTTIESPVFTFREWKSMFGRSSIKGRVVEVEYKNKICQGTFYSWCGSHVTIDFVHTRGQVRIDKKFVFVV